MKRDPVCNMEVREGEAVTAAFGGETYFFCSEGCRDAFLKGKGAEPTRPDYDLIIVGGGPAGLTAGVYAATLRMDAFLITGGMGGQAVDSTKIKNYMGFDFITGPELVEKFKQQLIHSHYIDHMMSDVDGIELGKEGFIVTTEDLRRYHAAALIVATGMTRRRLNVPGEEEFQRKGIFYGNVQDLSFIQDEEVVVVGGGNSAVQIVENLHLLAKEVHVVTDTRLTADPAVVEQVRTFDNVEIHEGYKVVRFFGKEGLEGVTIRRRGGGERLKLPAKGAFIAIGLQPNSSLVAGLVELNDRGEIVINPDCSTSCPGLFAAGDVTNAYGKRIIIASGEGAKAALAAREYILNLRKKGKMWKKAV